MTVSTYRTIRSHRNLSRQQLADKANVSARQIARIETAASPISLRTTTLERLAKALDVDVEVLLGRAPLPEGMDAANEAEMKIDGRSLADLRGAKGWSRRYLAEKSRVSQRQIARLEAAATTRVRATTLERLTHALDCDRDALAGDGPPVATPPTRRGHTVSAKVSAGTRLAYDLLTRRYGVGVKHIITLGPMLFTLLAEGCLARRREKLAQVKEAKDRLGAFAAEDDTLYFTAYNDDIQHGIAAEEQSIAEADIRGEVVRREGLAWTQFDTDDLFAVTPFAIYLEELAHQIGKPGVINFSYHDDDFFEDFAWGDLFGANPYQCCLDDLNAIADGSLRARCALERGDVRINAIPVELMNESATRDRVEWLERRLQPASTTQPAAERPNDELPQ
ncbi:MAG: helix-turn-helix transcriptional regulator [Gammaproteobacteria bacterium]|nr:helix-turn-helix transcriptional regulator [Gammaproteobacteria bacterium]